MGGKKNQVVLTFAGETKNLEDSIDKLGDELKKTEGDLDKLGDQSKRTEGDLDKLGAGARKTEEDLAKIGDGARRSEDDLDGLGDRVRGVDKVVGSGGRAFGDYGTGLAGVGDRADEVDTRMMGLSDGIQGVTDLMGGNGKLRPHEFAMAFSDLGSSLYNFVIPQMQSLVKTGGNVIDRLGGIKMAAGLAAGAAGLTALVVAIKNADEAANSRAMETMDRRLQATAFAATETNQAMILVSAATGHLMEQFDRALAAGPKQAEQFIELTEKTTGVTDATRDMRTKLAETTAAQGNATEASAELTEQLQTEADKIREVNDARRAAIDPLFGMLDGLQRNRDAQREVNEADAAYREAARVHGEGSVEAEEALRNLNAAQDDAVRSAFDYETAAADLQAQISEHPASLSNAKLALERWAAQGLISEDQARRMAVRFDNAASAARGYDGTYTARLRTVDEATQRIRGIRFLLEQVARTHMITLQAQGFTTSGQQLAGGGVVAPKYAAQGIVMGGPRGTDTVPAWLTPGEMVLNDGQQAQLWAMANGYGTGGVGRSPSLNVNLYVGGSIISERDLIRLLRDELERRGLAGLVR